MQGTALMLLLPILRIQSVSGRWQGWRSRCWTRIRPSGPRPSSRIFMHLPPRGRERMAFSPRAHMRGCTSRSSPGRTGER
jgi:hypothetical protein